MPDILPTELSQLPLPTVIEEIAYERRLALYRQRLVEAFVEVGIDYDVENIETDPAQIQLQIGTYQDILARQRINEAVRASFLAFARGTDIDHLAQFYDVMRLAGEDDSALKRRVVLAIRGRSTGGTEARYKSVALGADVRVADAAIYTVGRDPTVHVAIFSTAPDGVAGPDLVSKVNAALQRPEVRVVNDRIVVAAAVREVVNVSAEAWLLPDAPEAVLDQAVANLRARWAESMALGRDVTKAWLVAHLMVAGIAKVEIVAPAGDVTILFDRAAAIGSVSLINRGRLY